MQDVTAAVRRVFDEIINEGRIWSEQGMLPMLIQLGVVSPPGG